MKTATKLMLAVSAVALAACTKPDLPGSNLGGTFTAERFLEQDHGGSGFNGALAKEYTELARRSANKDQRWYNATAYIAKAEAAEAGADVGPWSPESLGVSGEAANEYDAVVAAILANRGERPEACARAQAMWDQYLEALRGQPGGCPDPEDARALFDEAMLACTGVSYGNSFVVYFGFNRTNLTDTARATLDEVVEAVQALSTQALSVVGHTDTVGSYEYNQGLSERRARRVADALVERGVPRGAMTLAGRGERELAVPTPDNTREPLNRRVEITLSQ
ncbi:OmpA family protein [Limibaculum sp. M0105]|uniref:OmpA family protein n=1 Tax=Thermohalobaculum xanthum TaxID=2753746 RepID=A0A8J7M6I3_9RHOB|nr:OmpA family protein [Thermohalobaculum xanthum]MBK0399254.1 OmpA family protein [Thermohalobaculum xanthum]